jgi:hypothetical protein
MPCFCNCYWYIGAASPRKQPRSLRIHTIPSEKHTTIDNLKPRVTAICYFLPLLPPCTRNESNVLGIKDRYKMQIKTNAFRRPTDRKRPSIKRRARVGSPKGWSITTNLWFLKDEEKIEIPEELRDWNQRTPLKGHARRPTGKCSRKAVLEYAEKVTVAEKDVGTNIDRQAHNNDSYRGEEDS